MGGFNAHQHALDITEASDHRIIYDIARIISEYARSFTEKEVNLIIDQTLNNSEFVTHIYANIQGRFYAKQPYIFILNGETHVIDKSGICLNITFVNSYSSEIILKQNNIETSLHLMQSRGGDWKHDPWNMRIKQSTDHEDLNGGFLWCTNVIFSHIEQIESFEKKTKQNEVKICKQVACYSIII